MAYIARELIKKKRDGNSLDEQEISWLISSYVNGDIPDYQVSAWLMAVFLKGMTFEEAASLTKVMRDSGEVIDLSHINLPKVDKHSTGGVGDKTSMILGSIVSCEPICVPMMAGRGLGHTGGTLDKLESIPGFNTQLTTDAFKKQLKEIGFSIIGQTEKICPADKKIYALRDVTATIESVPLICASIMSKKLAEGMDAICLDVKFGNGAFMKSFEDAKNLALSLKKIGELSGKKVSVVLSNMDQVLGRYVGNALEIQECVEIMKDPKSHQKYFDTVDLTLNISAQMFMLAQLDKDYSSAFDRAKKILESGRAFEKFQAMCKAQGGDLTKLPQPYEAYEVRASEEGYVESIDVERIGVAGILIGAGRQKVSDEIDYRSGFEIIVKVGDKVKEGDLLYKVFAKDPKPAIDHLRNAFSLTKDRINPVDLIGESLVSIGS